MADETPIQVLQELDFPDRKTPINSLYLHEANKMVIWKEPFSINILFVSKKMT